MPSALDIALEAKTGQVLTKQVEYEEVKKGRRYTCYIVIICLVLVAIIGLILFILFK